METLTTQDMSQIKSLVDGLTSDGGITSGNSIKTPEIENILAGYTSIYMPAIIIIGLILRTILRTIKEKIRANIRAKAFEKRAQESQKRELEKKPKQEDVIKNIFNEIK